METHDRGIGKRDDGDGSVPSGRKIVLKIKNRNPAPEMPEVVRAEEIKPHYCEQCDKMFSSGKALGGHMSSAHVQAGKDYSGKKPKSKTGEKWGSGDYDCGVCGKSFPSQKSLYGHMRCHPEREWRGMDPPGKRSESLEAWTEFKDDDDVMEDAETVSSVDTFYTLKTWGLKDRRGRSGRPQIVPPLVEKSPQDSSSDEEVEGNDLLSRQQLVRLLKWQPDSNEKEVGEGTTSDASSTLKNHMSESPESSGLKSCVLDFDGAKNKKRKWYHGCCPYHEETHLIKRQRANPESVDRKGEPDTKSDLIVGAICFLTNAKYITQAVDVGSSQEKHICSICNEVFPSHQALGGHKSSHNKLKGTIVNNVDKLKGSIANIFSNLTAQDDMFKGEYDLHVCLICKKWFPTARALGGHRKIHNNKGGRSIGIGGDEVKGGGDGGKGGDEESVGGEKLDFDLNMALDENGAAAGGGDESHVNGLVN